MNVKKILKPLYEAIRFDRTTMSDESAKKNRQSIFNTLTWSPEVEFLSLKSQNQVKNLLSEKWIVKSDSSVKGSPHNFTDFDFSVYEAYSQGIYELEDLFNHTPLYDFTEKMEELFNKIDYSRGHNDTYKLDKIVKVLKHIKETSHSLESSIIDKMDDDDKYIYNQVAHGDSKVSNQEVNYIIEKIKYILEDSPIEAHKDLLNLLNEEFDTLSSEDINPDQTRLPLVGTIKITDDLKQYFKIVSRLKDVNSMYEVFTLLDSMTSSERQFVKNIVYDIARETQVDDHIKEDYFLENDLFYGMELVPATKLNVRTMDEEINALFQQLDKIGVGFNETCGGHMHIGVNPSYHLSIADMLRLIINYELRRESFESVYDRSDMADEKFFLNGFDDFHYDLYEMLENDETEDAHVDMSYIEDHHQIINTNPISAGRFNTIEFRGAAGSIYSNPKTTKKMLSMYVDLVLDSWTGSPIVEVDEYVLKQIKEEEGFGTFAVFNSEGNFVKRLTIGLRLTPGNHTEKYFNKKVSENRYPGQVKFPKLMELKKMINDETDENEKANLIEKYNELKKEIQDLNKDEDAYKFKMHYDRNMYANFIKDKRGRKRGT